jgi:hypothetical protein
MFFQLDYKLSGFNTKSEIFFQQPNTQQLQLNSFATQIALVVLLNIFLLLRKR